MITSHMLVIFDGIVVILKHEWKGTPFQIQSVSILVSKAEVHNSLQWFISQNYCTDNFSKHWKVVVLFWSTFFPFHVLFVCIRENKKIMNLLEDCYLLVTSYKDQLIQTQLVLKLKSQFIHRIHVRVGTRIFWVGTMFG